MSVSHFSHRGTQIMFADYRECKKPEQQLGLLDEVATTMKLYPQVRLLVDYEGISAGPNYMTRLKEYGNTVFKEHMMCSAVLGITGLKKVLFNGYQLATGAKNVKAFASRNEALDWLVDYTP